MMRSSEHCLPAMAKGKQVSAEVASGRVWMAPDGQHYKVIYLTGDRAMLKRVTPAGMVLNSRYTTSESMVKMRSEWRLVAT